MSADPVCLEVRAKRPAIKPALAARVTALRIAPPKDRRALPKERQTPTQNRRAPPKKRKAPPKNQRAPTQRSPSRRLARRPHQHTEDTSNEGYVEQRNKDNEASEREGDESDPDDEGDPGHIPDYKGRVVSYTDPDSERPGHGIVGDYIKGQGYHVLFKYTDDLEPSECVDHCPLHWITDTLVDEETANAWNTAMEDARLQDSPLSSRHKKATQLPAKRAREQIKRFEPETTTSNAKTRKAKKKQKASLGDGVSNVHLQSSISMYIFLFHFRNRAANFNVHI